MSGATEKQKRVAAERQLHVASVALQKIRSGLRDPESIAQQALDEMWVLGPKQPLQGVVGHDSRRR